MNQAEVGKKYVAMSMALDLKVFIQFHQVSYEKRQNILPFIKAYFKEIMYIVA